MALWEDSPGAWQEVKSVETPAAETPWSPGPGPGATGADPDAVGTSDPLVKRASTTVTDTLQTNAPLVSPRPPQSPLAQDTSPANFSPY